MIFPQIFYQIVSYARGFLSINFFSSVTLETLASSCSKMYCKPIKWRAWLLPVQAQKGWVWPIISPKQVRWPTFLIVFFETDVGRENLKKVWKKLFYNFLFLRNHLNRRNFPADLCNLDRSQRLGPHRGHEPPKWVNDLTVLCQWHS